MYDTEIMHGCIIVFMLDYTGLHTVNCSNLGQPDITWNAKKTTILQTFQGPYFILPKKHRNVFAFKEIFHNREKRLTRN